MLLRKGRSGQWVLELRKKLDPLLAERSHFLKKEEEEEHSLQETKEQEQDLLQAQKLVQEVAVAVQASAHKQIASVVTRCLEAVFDDTAYEFVIEFERKRGKTEAKLTFVRDGHVLQDPVNEAGGGVVDVASFGLRLAALMLATPKRRRFLALDEPFHRVKGDGNRKRLASLIMMLAKEMGLQLLMVGDDWLRVGKVVQL
jgi:DNA repair exonuclease SbcCD ATPase subunit